MYVQPYSFNNCELRPFYYSIKQVNGSELIQRNYSSATFYTANVSEFSDYALTVGKEQSQCFSPGLSHLLHCILWIILFPQFCLSNDNINDTITYGIGS